MRYDGTPIPEGYNAGRALPPETADQWAGEFRRLVRPPVDPPRAVDVGCGTGRFSAIIARAFGVQVLGVDPSTQMLARAQAAPGVRFEAGAADRLPLRDRSVGLVFFSMVYHHIDRPSEALAEARRVLAPRGRALVRNSTVDTLDRTPLFEFFPEARDVEARRLPSRSSLEAEFSSAGFAQSGFVAVNQVFASSLEEYATKLATRSLSCLQLIDDSAFEAGMRRLRLAARASTGPVHEVIDLFCFSAPEAS